MAEGWHYLMRMVASGLALGLGGTLLYPKADGTLRPGAYASVGLGVEHAR